VRGSLIAIEGNNGSGKSTAAAHLAETLGAATFHYPPAFIRFRDDARMDTDVPARANLLYHLGATLHLSELVRERLATGHVVCDRYLPGPLSLLAARGLMSDDELEALSEPLLAHVVAPRVTLLLTASHEAACERIRERARGGELRPIERMVLASAELFAKREASLRRHARRMGPLVEIATTSLSIEAMRGEVGARAREALLG
jgi:thymidylate kinase